MVQINLKQTLENAAAVQARIQTNPIRTSTQTGTVQGLGEVSTAKNLAVSAGVPSSSPVPTAKPWHSITTSKSTSYISSGMPSFTTKSPTVSPYFKGTNSSTVANASGLVNPPLDFTPYSGLIDLVMGMNNQSSGVPETVQDIRVNDLIQGLSEYGQVTDFDMGMTDEGNLYVKNISFKPDYEDSGLYDSYAYFAGAAGSQQAQTATIFDYAYGVERFNLTSVPYLNPYRDTVYDYYGYQRADTMGYLLPSEKRYNKYIYTRWYNGFFDS